MGDDPLPYQFVISICDTSGSTEILTTDRGRSLFKFVHRIVCPPSFPRVSNYSTICLRVATR